VDGVTVSFLHEYALEWARRGRPVLPLERLSNMPHRRLLGSGWRFCSCTGEPTARLWGWTDPEVLTGYWTRDPAANVGVITGARSGLLVLDLDVHGRENGLAEFQLWEYARQQEGKTLPDHPVVRTPSGGIHRMFALPPGLHLKKNDLWLPGAEVKACGAQVAVFPSGRWIEREQAIVQYEFLTSVPLPVAPDWFLEDVVSRRGAIARREDNGAGGVFTGRSVLPDTAWFLEHGFGAEGGHREPDCYALACRLWREFPGDPGALTKDDPSPVTDVIDRVWETTAPKEGGRPFTRKDAHDRVENARRFVVKQRQQDIALARQLTGGQSP
jgi:hypothetical protein